MTEIWDRYNTYFLDNETCMVYGKQLDERLATVRADEFPLKPFCYAKIGNLYAYFNEYEKAKRYYEKGLENTEGMTERISTIGVSAVKQLLNNVGLIYRNLYNDLDKSDSFFKKIIEIEPPKDDDGNDARVEYELWIGLAKGNLGTNCYLRGEYEAAIPLLMTGVEKALQYNTYNYPYALGKAVTIAKIYIEKQDLAAAKRNVEQAIEIFELLRLKVGDGISMESKLLEQYYLMMSLYHRRLENAGQALLYADSAAVAHKNYEERFNLRKLHYAEMQEKQQQFEREAMRSRAYRRSLTVTATVALAILCLMALVYRMYRQKQAAYRVLVAEMQRMALSADTHPRVAGLDDAEAPDETDILIFGQLKEQMAVQRIFQNPDASLVSTAQLMGINRNYLSQAINRCTGGNFNSFVNDYRVKEAIRIMSDSKSAALSVEGIAFSAGFNDRTTFYRAFKKHTGVSFAVFRSNMS